ncbi:MAG: hypothetical protein ACI9B8_002040 [Sulfitobacter sp.]|jgi:hypothetical protein
MYHINYLGPQNFELSPQPLNRRSFGARRKAGRAAHLVDERKKALVLQAVPSRENRMKASEVVSKQAGFSLHAGGI